VIKLDVNNLTAIQQQRNGINFVECIIVALNIYGLRLDLCEFDTAGLDLLCVPEATFGLALGNDLAEDRKEPFLHEPVG